MRGISICCLTLLAAAGAATGSGALASSGAAPCRMTVPGAVIEETAAFGEIRCALPARAPVRAVARRGATAVNVPVRRLSPTRLRLTIVVPTPGRWTVTARLGPVMLAPRRIGVQRLPLREAFRVALDGDTLLVADAGGGRGRVVRIDPATGERSIVAGSDRLGRVYDVETSDEGLLVVVPDRLLRLRAGKAQVVASGLRGATDLAVVGDGTGYVVEADANRVRRVDLATGRLTAVVERGLDQPLAVAATRDGALYVADGHSGNDGQVRRIDGSGTLLPVIDGLALPVAVGVLPGDRLLVVDHVGHDANGSVLVYRGPELVEALAARTVPAPTSAVVARDGAVYVTSFAQPGVGRLDAAGRLRDLAP
jgi:hypothetical protein